MLQRLYVTMFPCNECAKLLIQAGITEVVFYEVGVISLLAHDLSSDRFSANHMQSSCGVTAWRSPNSC